MSVFDRIRALLNDTDLSEPADVAGKLLADMGREERADAFAEVAEMVVSVFMTRDRMHPGERPQAGRPAQTRAQRVAGWWKVELRKRYRGAEGWLMLGEFSADDHTFAAGERRSRAAAILAVADWHERCAEAMRAAEADHFEDLPAEVLVDLISARRPA